MLKLESLLEGLAADGLIASPCRLESTDSWGEDDRAFIIVHGRALLRDTSVFSADIHSTQTFDDGDPIGFAETISKRPWRSTFTFTDPLEVIPVEGPAIRQAVNRGGFLAREIIRNGIQRIFRTEKKPNANFEEEFIRAFKDHFSKRSYPKGELVYAHGQDADRLYFIQKGAVTLYTDNNAEIAQLGETDFFGERSLIKGVPRASYACAEEDCSLLVLEADQVRAEITDESLLVQLSLLAVLKRMHLMNQLRFSHIFRDPSERIDAAPEEASDESTQEKPDH